jgi:hypothetical protein
VIATPTGYLPTFTVAITVFVAVSITEVVLLPAFVTYANCATGTELCLVYIHSAAEKIDKNKRRATTKSSI